MLVKTIPGPFVGDLDARMALGTRLQEHASIKAMQEAKLRSKFDFKLVNEVQVAKALDKLQPRKACGWNPSAPPSLLKMAASGVAPSLTHLYNDCIITGKWPRQWKMGEWTPAFKKGGVQEKSNYRTMTSLIAVDKVFEQLLGEQVTEHFNPILYSRSTAYRKKHSCETTLLSMLEDWKLAIDRRELVCILSTDMSKAFDSLCPSLLLKKLEANGFTEQALELMRSYFEDRLNRVKIGNTTSEWRDMTRGCPQGSSFGPLMWNIFQNDLALHINSGKLNMYADDHHSTGKLNMHDDDHQIYSTGHDLEKVRATIVEEGELAATWYKKNYLLANVDKFQTTVINPRRLNDTNTY